MNDGRSATVSLMVSAIIILTGGGCAGTKPNPLPPVMAAALHHNERGIRAEAAGRQEEALSEFGEALKKYRAIEDGDGVTLELINLSRTCRLNGNLGRSREYLVQAGQTDDLPPHLAAELLFEWAKLSLAEGDAATADRYVRKLFTIQGEASPARTYNLAGLTLLRLGNCQDALSNATIALHLAQGSGQLAEEANAYRLLGRCHAAAGDRMQAENAFERALTLDKQLANPRKIADDLRGLGELAARHGESDTAIAYFRRAITVSGNAGDAASEQQDLQRVEELYRKAGRIADAELVARHREALARGAATTNRSQQ